MTETTLADTLTVQNVVASTAINQELALQPLADDLDGADYRTEPLPTLTYYPTETAPMVRLFRTGALMALGAPSRATARESLTHALGDLDGLGIPVPAAPDITIQNMVFTATLDTTLNLSAVAVGLGLDRTEYEPEQYPALVYRPAEAVEVVQIYASGKLVITGTTAPASATTALTALADQLTDLGLREE
jgi:transcription initiation factor TFIID TATA-box-binding protein